VSSSRAATPRRGALAFFLAVTWLACSAAICAQSQPEPANAAPAAAPPAGQRLRIGLVLSGGGARGAAHVGVLKVLEEMHVPIDAIAGTSMGAVVGGLYASGLSAEQIETLMRSTDWQEAFRGWPAREDLSLRRKQEDESFLVKFPLGLRGGHVILPKGLIQGQKLTETLRRLTLPVARIDNFDDLPTRFRAVATDLENGAAVIMGSGDLTSAMRASVSAPGVFAPYERDGRALVDGGLVDNVPVDIARAMGVDVLIVVDVGFPLLQLKQLSSAPLISNQMLAILIQRSSQAQLATLTPRDVLIQPPLGSISSFDFGAVSKAIATGEVAARARAGQLASLAVTEPQMQLYAQQRAARREPPPVIDFVKVSPDSESYIPPPAQRLFKNLEGKPLDADAAQAAVTALYGRGSLDMLDYRVIGSDDRYGLVLDARPTWHGPDYMRFGLSLQDDLQGGSTYNAAVRFVVSDVTRNAGEWVTDLQVGTAAQISTELFLPLAQFSGWFVMPHVAERARDIDLVQNQDIIAEYRIHTFDYGLDFGRQFGNWGEVRTGISREEGHYHLNIGDPTDPNVPDLTDDPFDTINYFVRLTYDRLDDINFPHRGQQAILQWTGVHNNSGPAPSSDQLTFNYTGAHTWGRNTLVLSGSGGETMQAQVTDVNQLFPLGGFLNLSGLRADSLLGPNFGIARLIYYRQVGRGGPGWLDVPTYLGASLEAGNVWQTRSDASFGNTRKDASIFIGMDTLLGPLYLASGFDQHGDQAFYLFLGRSF
jgi:NTE family protein